MLRRAISNLVAGLIIAIAIASATAFYVHWARSQASRLPQQLFQPCPVTVQAIQNGSSYLVFVVFNGDMDSGESIYIVAEDGSVTAVEPQQRGTAYTATLTSTPTHWICRGAIYSVSR